MPTDVSARVPLIAFFVYLFTAFYSPGKFCAIKFHIDYKVSDLCLQVSAQCLLSMQLNVSHYHTERSA
jgi:hypothetical protein